MRWGIKPRVKLLASRLSRLCLLRLALPGAWRVKRTQPHRSAVPCYSEAARSAQPIKTHNVMFTECGYQTCCDTLCRQHWRAG